MVIAWGLSAILFIRRHYRKHAAIINNNKNNNKKKKPAMIDTLMFILKQMTLCVVKFSFIMTNPQLSLYAAALWGFEPFFSLFQSSCLVWAALIKLTSSGRSQLRKQMKLACWFDGFCKLCELLRVVRLARTWEITLHNNGSRESVCMSVTISNRQVLLAFFRTWVKEVFIEF